MDKTDNVSNQLETMIQRVETAQKSRCVFCSRKTNYITDFEDRSVNNQVFVCHKCSAEHSKSDVPSVRFLQVQVKTKHWVVRLFLFLLNKKDKRPVVRTKKETVLIPVPMMDQRQPYQGMGYRGRSRRSQNIGSTSMGIAATKMALKSFKL